MVHSNPSSFTWRGSLPGSPNCERHTQLLGKGLREEAIFLINWRRRCIASGVAWYGSEEGEGVHTLFLLSWPASLHAYIKVWSRGARRPNHYFLFIFLCGVEGLNPWLKERKSHKLWLALFQIWSTVLLMIHQSMILRVATCSLCYFPTYRGCLVKSQSAKTHRII